MMMSYLFFNEVVHDAEGGHVCLAKCFALLRDYIRCKLSPSIEILHGLMILSQPLQQVAGREWEGGREGGREGEKGREGGREEGR